jgi:uncharacterized membrane protein SpoIIM required for sporulation
VKQAAFERAHHERWEAFERQVVALDAREIGSGRRSASSAYENAKRGADFPRLYREVCRDLSLARARQYGPELQARLNALALAGHRHLYWRETEFLSAFIRFVAHGFPARVRADSRFIAVASALFVVPGLIFFFAVMANPELVYSLMGADQIRDFESMYDPSAARIGSNRSASSDIQMFGFYIQNNIGVGFRTFASGMLLGVGSAFFLVFNSLLFGGLSAHILHLDYGITFFPFVIGHGSFELTAIVISGAAGLKLGYALIAPGARGRANALRVAASESLELIYGVIAMLVIAALLEAFWSSKSALAPELKLTVGSILWACVLGYFVILGRRREA